MFCVVNTKVMEIMMYQIGYIDGQCLRKFIQACGHKATEHRKKKLPVNHQLVIPVLQ